jgi:hypothetical protein
VTAKRIGSDQKKRRLGIFNGKLTQLLIDLEAGRVRLCFGSKRLFRKQFNLAANGYDNDQANRHAIYRASVLSALLAVTSYKLPETYL